MFNELKNTVKQTSIYSLGNLSTKLVGFVLLPLYTGYLTSSEYGILAILQAIGQILIGVFGFNLPTAMMRWYTAEKSKSQQDTVVFTTLLSTLIISLLLSLILIPFSREFSLAFFNDYSFANYFIILFLSVSAGIISNVPLNLIRLKEKAFFYITLTITKFTIIVLLNIYFVAKIEIGVEGIIISELVGNLFIIIFTAPFLIKNSVFKINLSILFEMFKFGIPLIFSTVFTFTLTLGDRFIIQYFHGDSSVGVYSLGHKVASVLNMLIIQSFQLGFLPIAYKKFEEPNAKRYFSKVLTYYTLILVFSALVISLFSKELIELLALRKEYWIAYSVLPIISFAFVLKGIQFVFSLSFHYTKKTIYNATIVLITASISVLLNIILVEKYDFMGAAITFLISLLVLMLLSYFIGQKVYFIPYEKFKLIKIFFTGVTLFLCSYLFNEMQIIPRLFLKTGLVLSFPIILFYLNVFDRVEIDKAKELLYQKKKD